MCSDIVIVQPDAEQSSAIRALLESHGHSVTDARSVDNARTAVKEVRPDAVIVHWGNWLSANEFFQSSVQANGHASCAIVTARDAELADAMAALDIGYDDCVRVPVNETELLARLNACLKRKKRAANDDEVAVGPLVLNKTLHNLSINGKQLQLAPTEYRLLTFFLENPERVFNRDEILKGAWQRSITAGSRTVDVHVRRLRQILQPHGCDKMIQTVRSFGYRFRETINGT